MTQNPTIPNPITVTILPAQPPDYHPIAALEAQTFYHEPFTIVAFGPLRGTPKVVSVRGEGLAKQPTDKEGNRKKGEWNLVTKAVDENGIIVGAAAWGFVTSGEGQEVGEVEVEGRKEVGEEVTGGDWPEGANVKFCEEFFGKGDRLMAESCKGKDYAKLSVLVVSPSYQRRGIGAKILEHGLKEVDKLGLQCVLGASKEGLGLYTKFGFEKYETIPIKLWEYEGGEGFGSDEQVIMNRPARKV
ncbi:hypothetical protein EG329_007782 [Mollisiaceae sp. DMI_Dod_QoI]|nr:hypothetical protein EG329_007782 [Helotiales sp. DMI_Dod_QoI]